MGSPLSATPLSSDGDAAQPMGDATLVARVRRGDQAALGEIFNAYYSLLCGFAASYVGTVAGAEDLVQELFLHLWTTRAAWDVRGGLRAYLFGAVRNRALNVEAHRQVERRLQPLRAVGGGMVLDAGDVPGHGGGPASPDAALLAADAERTVGAVLERLPERLRAVVHLRWRVGLSYAEIAATLGVSEKAVEHRIARALKVLRRRLAAYW